MSIWRRFSMYRFVNESKEFLDAWNFQLNYEPKKGEDYSWVQEHAQREFSRLSGGIDTLDEKADGLIRYLGAGSVFVSLSLFIIDRSPQPNALFVVAPTLLLLLVSLIFAIIARKPQFHPAPPYTQEAFRFADFFGSSNGASARFFAKVGAASVALKLAGEFKAFYIRQSFRLFAWAIAYLVISTLGFFLWGWGR